jgi:hypothetical protein
MSHSHLLFNEKQLLHHTNIRNHCIVQSIPDPSRSIVEGVVWLCETRGEREVERGEERGREGGER